MFEQIALSQVSLVPDSRFHKHSVDLMDTPDTTTTPRSPHSLRTDTSNARHNVDFIRRKRASSTQNTLATLISDDKTDECLTRKWKNRSAKRLLRAVRYKSFNEDEEEDIPHSRHLFRQPSDDFDDDSLETGFGTYTRVRESSFCQWTFFILHDVIFSPPILSLFFMTLVIFYFLSYIDAYVVEEGDGSGKLAQAAKLLPGQKTGTQVIQSVGTFLEQFVAMLPEKLQDPVKLLSPGIVFTTALSFLNTHLYRPFMDELKFSDDGFQNRVSITINTLEDRDNNSMSADEDRKYRQSLVMRTVKEMSLEELLPNPSALKLMQRAGIDIQHEEDGPIVALYEIGKIPCHGWFDRCCKMRGWCRTLCWLRKEVPSGRQGGFCCGLPRCNSFLCGTVKHHYLYCDPILRFHACDAGLKKKISDQIVNQLSECTSGNHFLGYEMGLPYSTVDYVWGLTFEQPIKGPNDRTPQDSRNRKYRILLARKEMVEFANEQDPWDVFTMGKTGKDNEYFDRRWVHLRTMGQIFKAKKELKSGDNVDGIDNDEDRKKSIAWLETFFVGELKVVAPMPIGCDIVRRAWEKEHTWQVEHAKWMEERGEIGDNTIQTTSRQKSWTKMSQEIRVPSTNSSNSRRSVNFRKMINTRHSSLSSSPLSLRRHKSEDAMLKRE